MAQLRDDQPKFDNAETQIVVVGPEKAKAFARFWRTNDLRFIGLPDPKREVLRRFGQEVKIFKLGRMPAQVIVDKEGVVRHGHYGHSMSDIPSNEEILGILDDINS